MKYTIFLLVIFYSIFQFGLFADAAMSYSPPNPIRQPGGCYEYDVGHLRGGDKVMVPGQCKTATCEWDGAITYMGCGTVSTKDPGCYETPVDLSKPYPKCCPSITCMPWRPVAY